jgi:flagellar biosynthesis anti-sigma factor FlgM
MNSIKINGSNDIEVARTTLRPEAGREPEHHSVAQSEAAKPSAAPEINKDVITVSDRATTIRSLVEQARQLPDVRSEQVERLRSLIQANEYHREATTIADALLNNIGH